MTKIFLTIYFIAMFPWYLMNNKPAHHVIVWCRQATGHYTNQLWSYPILSWSRSETHNAVTAGQWIKHCHPNCHWDCFVQRKRSILSIFIQMGVVIYACVWFCDLVQERKLAEERALGHYSDVIMGVIASQITSLTIVCTTVYSGADQGKHQSSASLAFVRGSHRSPVNSPPNWPVTRKMFSFDDVIMLPASPLGRI